MTTENSAEAEWQPRTLTKILLMYRTLQQSLQRGGGLSGDFALTL